MEFGDEGKGEAGEVSHGGLQRGEEFRRGKR
jgi:hypothetical protein